MTPRLFHSRWLLAALLSIVAAASAGASDAPTPDFSAWLEDAAGMSEAARLYQERPRPVFVYFYTDWCPYCRQFERELLTADAVADYLDGRDVVAVRINPENGPAEAEISRRYGVGGYPALFMLGTESGSWSMIERMVIEDGRPRLKSPGAFVDALKQASAR